jgi:hypothetical protein
VNPSLPAPPALDLLEIAFEGRFMCRQATDPDPTNEDRGMSGYTMALVSETPLDQVIRFHVTDDFWRANARPPSDEMGMRPGVTVRGVRYAGAPYPRAQNLIGARVFLDGKEPSFDGPIFESRNNIVGNDDAMAFVVSPFKLRIEKGDPRYLITLEDYLDPADPNKKLVDMDDPATYARRLTTCLAMGDNDVSEAVGVYDAFGYFRDRRRYLEKRIGEAEAALPNASGAERAALRAEIGACRSRIHQLEHWGDRVISKIQMRCDWAFSINGPQHAEGDFGGKVVTDQPWSVAYWFGGWDGDLLSGWFRGTLSVPFFPG